MSTTTTVSIPCPECGQDVTRTARIQHDAYTENQYIVWAETRQKSEHACKPEGIDPESLEDWTLCEVASGDARAGCWVRGNRYKTWTDNQDAHFPSHWRIVRTIPTGDNVTTSEPDPPQPEWRDGDLVLDKDGYLWKRGYRYWYNAEDEWGVRGDDGLIGDRGPLRRAYLADPAKGEVVVSIEGLDRSFMRFAAEDIGGWSGAFVLIAKAAQAAGLLDEEA